MRRRFYFGIAFFVTMTVCGVIVLITMIVGRPTNVSSRELDDLLWETGRLASRGDYESAESTYKSIIIENADNNYGLAAQKELVQLYLRSGHPERAAKACEDLKRHFSRDKGLPLAISEVAYSYRRGDKFDEAVELYRYVIANWPRREGSFKAYQDLAVLLIGLERADEAGGVIARLIKNFPAKAKMVRTAMMIGQGSRYQHGEANGMLVYRYVSSIIRSRPRNRIEICSRGLRAVFDVAFEGLGAEDAIDDLMSDFKGHPDLAEILYHTGIAYTHLCGYYERKEMQEKADECTGKAIAVWERIIEELPRSKTTASAYLIAGICYKSLGRRDKEFEYHQKIVELWPEEKISCSALFRISRYYSDLLRNGKISREEGAVKLCEISRRIISDFPDDRFYVRSANIYLKKWKSVAANYVLVEKSGKPGRPGVLGGYWEKLAAPIGEDQAIGAIGVEKGGVLWINVSGKIYYKDGGTFREAVVEHPGDQGDAEREGNMVLDRRFGHFYGGGDRELYAAEPVARENRRTLYRLSEGKASYVTDYYYETKWIPLAHYLHVSESGILVNWGQHFVAAYVDGEWDQIEVGKGGGPIAEAGEKVYFHRDGCLHWVDRAGIFGKEEGIGPIGTSVHGILWGDDRLILYKDRSLYIYDIGNWERISAAEKKIRSVLGSRGILGGFRVKDGSVWVVVRDQTLRAYVFVSISPSCEITMVAETAHWGWNKLRLWQYPRSFVGASDGSLWFSTPKNGISRWRNGNLDFFGWKQGHNLGSKAKLLEGRDGRMYAACAEGVYAYRPELKGPLAGWVKQWEEYKLASSHTVQDFEGNIWMALKDQPGKISRWDGQGWRHVTVPFETSSLGRVMVDDRGHVLWETFGHPSKGCYDICLDGAIHYEDAKSMIAAAVGDGAKKFHTDKRRQSCVVTEGGKIWFCYRGSSEVQYFDGEGWDDIRIGKDNIYYVNESLKYGVVFETQGKKHYTYDRGQIVEVVIPDSSDWGVKSEFPGGRWNNKSGSNLRRFFGSEVIECDLHDSPLFGYWRYIHQVFEDRAGNVWIEERGSSRSDGTVFVKRTDDFTLRAEDVPTEAFRSIEVEVESLVGDRVQEGTRLFWRFGKGGWQGSESEDLVVIEFPWGGRYEVEVVGMGPVGGLTRNRVKFSVDATVPLPETKLTARGAYAYLKIKEPNAITDLLSEDDINAINSYREKYQSFPGPSDAEVFDVAKILLGVKLSEDDIGTLLGGPSSISEISREDSLKCWRYDIGDSRGIAVCFDAAGDITSIRGVGVGFDTVMAPGEQE